MNKLSFKHQEGHWIVNGDILIDIEKHYCTTSQQQPGPGETTVPSTARTLTSFFHTNPSIVKTLSTQEQLGTFS